MRGCFVRQRFVQHPSHSALGRLVALVCVLALLTVSFGHTVQHHDTFKSAASHEVSVSSSDDSSEPVERSTAPSEHCHACSMIASIDHHKAVSVLVAGSDRLSMFEFQLRTHTPLAENPPPIVLT